MYQKSQLPNGQYWAILGGVVLAVGGAVFWRRRLLGIFSIFSVAAFILVGFFLRHLLLGVRCIMRFTYYGNLISPTERLNRWYIVLGAKRGTVEFAVGRERLPRWFVDSLDHGAGIILTTQDSLGRSLVNAADPSSYTAWFPLLERMGIQVTAVSQAPVAGGPSHGAIGVVLPFWLLLCLCPAAPLLWWWRNRRGNGSSRGSKSCGLRTMTSAAFPQIPRFAANAGHPWPASRRRRAPFPAANPWPEIPDFHIQPPQLRRACGSISPAINARYTL